MDGEFRSPLIAISFVIGAVASGLAGYFGMRVATAANVHTTAAARQGLAPALAVAFAGGSVMGMSVVGLALLGLGGLYILYNYSGGFSWYLYGPDNRLQYDIAGTLGNGAWGYIVGTYDKDAGTNNQRLYLNGTRVAQMSDTQPLDLNANPLGIGRHVSGIADPFNGHIDAFRICPCPALRRLDRDHLEQHE
jgi:hypothetical protein